MAGVLGVGYLVTSIASFATNGSNVGKSLNFGGISVPAVTAATLPAVAIIVGLLFVIKAIISIALTRIMAIQIAFIEARAAQEICKNVMGGSAERVSKISKEELILAVQAGASTSFTGVLNSFANFIAEGMLFVFVSISFFLFNPLATAAMLAYFSLLGYVVHLFVGRKLSKASKSAYENIVKANTILGDLLSAFRELTVNGNREKFFNRIYLARKAASRSIGEQTYLSGMPRHIIETGLILGLATLILSQSGSTDLAESAATIGIFLAGGFRIVAAMLPWQNSVVSLRISVPQSLPTWDLLQMGPGKSFNVVKKSHPKGPAKVEFKSVNFAYADDANLTISDLSLVIEPGKSAAIIGNSGSGKSTVADLMLGLLDPRDGEILLNGESSKLAIKQDGNFAAYVPQAPGMVSGTILDNIVLGQSEDDLDEESLEKAIEGSNLEEFLSTIPGGLHASIGANRDSFSGGQMQRIGLARALYAQPSLIILDEATSALDAESEDFIVQALQQLKGKVTVVTIAHRLNSIQNADVIFVLAGGKLVASGSLKQLEKSNENVARAIELLKIDS